MGDTDTHFAQSRLAHDPLPVLVFDVSYWDGRCNCCAVGMRGDEAAKLRLLYPGAVITPRKLLPCAQRRSSDARIAALPLAGTTPANPAGGGDL